MWFCSQSETKLGLVIDVLLQALKFLVILCSLCVVLICFNFYSDKGLDFWMTWYFRLPGEEQQGDLPIGLKCVPVLMDMWGNSANLAPQDFGMNRQTGVRLRLVCLATATDMQIFATLKPVSSVYSSLLLFVFSRQTANSHM